MKKLLIFALAALVVAGLVWIIKDWTDFRANYELIRSDWAISRTKSWRMRIEVAHPRRSKEWMVVEAILPDREHGWQHVDGDAIRSTMDVVEYTPIRGDLEYIRIRDDRYFRGDALFGHGAAPQWINLIPRDSPPLDGFFELRLHLSNPRTIGYSFDYVSTNLWSNYHGSHMRPIGLKTYSGHSCLEWGYTWKIRETGQVMRDTLCIGTLDHLPYHLTASGGWAEATYEWNPQVSIDAPNPVFPRPAGFTSYPP